VTSNVGKKR